MKRTGWSLAAVFTVLILLAFGCSKPSDSQLMRQADLYYGQADSLLRINQPQEARQMFLSAVDNYSRLIDSYPDSPRRLDAHYRAGMIYASGLGDHQKAISVLHQAVYQYPDSNISAHCQFMIGYIYHNMARDTAMARKAYLAFLDRYSRHELAQSVQWELDHMGEDINQIPEFKNLDGDTRLEMNAR